MIKLNEETIDKWTKLCKEWLMENDLCIGDVGSTDDAWVTIHSAVKPKDNPLMGMGLTDEEFEHSMKWAMAQIFIHGNIYHNNQLIQGGEL
jgi:hypothetical protein